MGISKVDVRLGVGEVAGRAQPVRSRSIASGTLAKSSILVMYGGVRKRRTRSRSSGLGRCTEGGITRECPCLEKMRKSSRLEGRSEVGGCVVVEVEMTWQGDGNETWR